MVIVELIGGLSIAIAFVSAITLAIIHIRNKQNDITSIHNDQLQQENNQILSVLSLQKFNQSISITSPSRTVINEDRTIINVIDNDTISSTPIKYGIQWKVPINEDINSDRIKSSINIVTCEHVDSLSFGDQCSNVRHAIEELKTNSIGENFRNEKNNQIKSDLISIDSQTMETDRNQNEQKISHHSSISNLDVTIPSNISSTIDLEQFQCFSSTSNLSEFIKNHE
ncbi:unnamed protein product [Adineta steineri]|uniref:Uncharacterized protein n=1 Tax=Adineta steineri TaxID=433720 RepID=A0A814A918_9BILA|nr:unnamed protein product [Adineta steineri]CAF1396865.1 unnamed protein product [Adineta steineri]